jgi:hypothetical protein
MIMMMDTKNPSLTSTVQRLLMLMVAAHAQEIK